MAVTAAGGAEPGTSSGRLLIANGRLVDPSQDLDGGLLAKQDSPSKQVARREQGVLLADALALLPEDYREVLILRHLEGLSFPDVAQRLGRTLDAVKKVWTRALARLRRSLKGVQ